MKILISGYYGFGNCGDEAVLRAIRRGFKDHELTVIEKKIRYSFFKIVREILRSDLFLSGGGTLFQNKTSNRSFYYYLGLILLAKLLRRRVMIIAQGFGPLKGRINRLLAKLILDRVNIITLRDNDSFREIQKLGVKRPDIEVTADPTFILNLPDPEIGKTILTLEGVKLGEKPLLGIAVRTLPKEFSVRFVEIIDYLSEKYNYTPVLVPFQAPEDMGQSNRIISNLREGSHIIFRNCMPSEMLSIFSQFDLVIGMRLHSLIFAALNITPMLGISYDPKVEAFMKEIEQPYVDINHPAGMKAALEAIIKNRESIKQKLAVKKKELQEKAQKNFSVVEGIE
ncbi:MAG: polysaccharide pyruvyl transferase CsaB [Candidatus Margulisiibacteriota bacterium]|nr:polysaccharide pyruvyl transferase CsaB [Candidatus Margulisiibacteriota bacterium]